MFREEYQTVEQCKETVQRVQTLVANGGLYPAFGEAGEVIPGCGGDINMVPTTYSRELLFVEFMETVARVPWSDCWYWLGLINSGGARFRSDSAARVILSHVGRRPDRSEPKRICKQPSCVNPDHLIGDRDNERR